MITLEEYEDYPIDLRWQDLLPTDDLQAAQTALLWRQMGVSRSTLLQTGGFDPVAEMEKSAQEDALQLTNASRGRAIPPVSLVSQGLQQSSGNGGQEQ
jgi:hypothetical protein